MPARTDKETELKVVELYQSGLSSGEIYKSIGVKTRNVWRILERYGIEKRSTGQGGKDSNRRKLPEKEEILRQFLYDERNGLLIYKKSGIIARPTPTGQYITVSFTQPNGKSRTLSVHRVILFLETGEEPEQVDHIDLNKLNNHISNLRSATASQNNINKLKKEGTSKHKGVSWNEERGRWRVQLWKDGNLVLNKRFKNEIDAARAYNEAVLEHFGEFAILNIIEED